MEGIRRQRYWLANDPVLTHFFNALQATFPEGERFFIDSARDVRVKLGEQSLAEPLASDVRAFIRQEAWHGQAHEQWNAALKEMGYTRIDDFSAQQLRLRQWANENISARMRLAITAGAEHMTASLARIMLYRRRDLIDAAAEPFRSLLAWHALEEIEHKAVCFDLYQRAGGRYGRRISALLLAFLDTLRLVYARHRYFLKKDGLWNTRTRIAMVTRVWGPTGLIGQLVPELLRYLRPGFHPWDTDERDDFAKQWQGLISELAPDAA